MTVGFTVKSGWAAAVVAEPVKGGIRIRQARRIDLSDPDLPDSKQPYHDGFATMRKPGATLTRLLASVRQYGRRSMGEFLDAAGGDGQIDGAGVIVGSLIDPATIGNEHIRIHAMEGQLFREVVCDAAEKLGVACTIWRERDLLAAAVTALKQPEGAIRRLLADAGRGVAGPWRAEQKNAALGAWLVSRGGHPATRRDRR